MTLTLNQLFLLLTATMTYGFLCGVIGYGLGTFSRRSKGKTPSQENDNRIAEDIIKLNAEILITLKSLLFNDSHRKL